MVVLDGDPAPPPPKGHPQFSAHICCGQMAAWINVAWYGARPRPRRLCVRWRFSTPPPKGGRAPPFPIFGQFLLWPNGWMHQDATWYGCRLRPGDFVLDGESVPLSDKGAEPPNFRPMFIVAKRLDGSRCHLVWR